MKQPSTESYRSIVLGCFAMTCNNEIYIAGERLQYPSGLFRYIYNDAAPPINFLLSILC